MSRVDSALRRSLPLFCLLLLSLVESPAVLAQSESSSGTGYYDDAREFYRQRRYGEAADYLRMAIQLDPAGDPRYYIGLARACFYAEAYDQAVYYYDIYLQHFPEHSAEARRRTDRTEAIQAERTEANRLRANPAQPPAMLPEQFAAYQALQQRIEAGVFLDHEHTGAYHFFRTLMRTRYAHPDLISIRTRLIEGLVHESAAQFNPNQESPVPVATPEEWRLVFERYRVIEELGQPILETPEAQARILTAQAQIDLINTNYHAAIQRFEQALLHDPGLLAAHFGRHYAIHRLTLLEDTPPDPSVLLSLPQLRTLTALQAPQHLELVEVVKAMTLSSMGHTEEAAAIIIGLLVPERSASSARIEPATTEETAREASPLERGELPADEPPRTTETQVRQEDQTDPATDEPDPATDDQGPPEWNLPGEI